MNRVCIIWEDSCISHGERTMDEIERVAKMETVGIVIENTDQHIIIARDIHKAPNLMGALGFRDCICIPKLAICSIVELHPETPIK